MNDAVRDRPELPSDENDQEKTGQAIQQAVDQLEKIELALGCLGQSLAAAIESDTVLNPAGVQCLIDGLVMQLADARKTLE